MKSMRYRDRLGKQGEIGLNYLDNTCNDGWIGRLRIL